MKRTTWKRIIGLVLALSMVFVLCSCGGSSSAPAPAAASSAKSEAAAPAAEAKSEAAPAAEASSAKSEAAPAEEAKSEAAPAAAESSAAPEAAEDSGSEFDITKVDTSDWEKLDLSYATYLTADNPIGKLCTDAWQTKLDELMPGWVTITIYPSGTLLGQADIFEGVEQGIADLGMVDVSSVKELLPTCALWALPGTHASSTTAGSAAMNEWVNMVAEDLPELENVVVLHAQGNQAGQMVTAFQWDSIDQLKGKQLRATAAFADIVTALGATPVSVATSELYEASRSGLIDGAYYTITANYLQGSNEFLKYGTFTNMCTSPYLYIMNRDKLESLPETEQAFLKEAFAEAFWELVLPHLPDVGDIHEATQRAIESGDYIVYELPEETLNDLWETCGPITDKYIEENSSVPNLKENYDLLVKLTEKWNEWYPMERYVQPFMLSAEKGFDYVLEHIDEFAIDPLPEIYGYVPLDKR